MDAASACAQFAQAAATVDTATGDLGRSRQDAARTFGTPQLQALFSGAGQGRSAEQETWRQHQAAVTATTVPDDHGDHDDYDDYDDDVRAGAGQARPGTPVAVTVTGTARGADGWTAPVAPYRLDCLTVQDPVVGWLVDDVVVTALPAAAEAG